MKAKHSIKPIFTKSKALLSVFSFLVFLFFFSHFGCKKESAKQPTKPNIISLGKANDFNFCDSLMDLIQIQNGTLRFQSISHMNFVLQCLENQVEGWNANFDSQIGNVSDAVADSIVDAIGFNEDLPLVNFENRFSSFLSMRKNVSSQIDSWLDNTELNPATDPEEAGCVADDEELQSVLNVAGEAYIGTQLVSFCSEIGTGSVDEVTDRASCHTWGKSKKFFEYDNGKKKFKLKVTLRNYAISTTAKAKIVSFKKKSNGKWKRYRSTLFVQVGGINNDPNCLVTLDPFGNFKGPKKRRRLITRFQQWMQAQPIRLKSNDGWGAGSVDVDQYTWQTVPLIF